jgi:hypothetical protein
MFSPELWATKRVEDFGRHVIKNARRAAEGRKNSLGDRLALDSAAFVAGLVELLARRESETGIEYDTPELRAASVYSEQGHKSVDSTDKAFEKGSFVSFFPGAIVIAPSLVFNSALSRKSIRPKGMSAARAIEMLNDPTGEGFDKPHANANPTDEEMRNYAIGPAQDWEYFYQHAPNRKKRKAN